jgi:hypothetical protein
MSLHIATSASVKTIETRRHLINDRKSLVDARVLILPMHAWLCTKHLTWQSLFYLVNVTNPWRLQLDIPLG